MPTTRYFSYRRRKRRRNFLLVFLLILLLTAAGVLTWLAVSSLIGKHEESSLGTDGESSESIMESESLPENSFAENSTIVSEPESQPEESSEAAESSVLEESSQITEVWSSYDQPLPKGIDMGEDYFSDAVFIGDSRTQGFILYSGLSNTTMYADKGLSVESVFTKECISTAEGKVSIMDALAQNPDFKKAYVMLGVNELGWAYPSIFQEKYQKLIQRIKEINPDAEIYVQSILPVSQEKSDGDKVYNNPRIQEYNQLIQEVAVEEKVYYLNVAEAVADENGALPADASTDGVHLNKAYCEKWLEYLKNHTVEGLSQATAEDSVESVLEQVQASLQTTSSDAADQ